MTLFPPSEAFCESFAVLVRSGVVFWYYSEGSVVKSGSVVETNRAKLEDRQTGEAEKSIMMALQ